MKHAKLLLLAFPLVFSILLAIPVLAAQDDPRTAPPQATGKSPNIVHPTGSFDPIAAKASLEPGAGTIRGKACVVKRIPAIGTREVKVWAVRQTVVLYPASAYIENMLELMRKAKPGKTMVAADPAITSIHLEGKTNEIGEFQFSQIKPGRYFLAADVSTKLYRKQYNDFLSQTVEVKGDEVANVTLFKGTTFLLDQLPKCKLDVETWYGTSRLPAQNP
jgi:hypothetical protein